MRAPPSRRSWPPQRSGEWTITGLVWRSHPEALEQSEEANADVVRSLRDASAEVALDARTRRGGSHHQKLVVCRSERGGDIAFVGGIDLAFSRADDSGHLGDPQVLENPVGTPVYVHSKVVVIDDTWARVGSDNMNRRSWTHDSELSCAVLDTTPDPRAPHDPGDLGDGARVFARDLRLELWREHLDATSDDGLLDPADAFASLRTSAKALQAWYDGGSSGARLTGRLRPHVPERPPPGSPLGCPGIPAAVRPRRSRLAGPDPPPHVTARVMRRRRFPPGQRRASRSRARWVAVTSAAIA